jgi:DNA-binding transcriptional regulator YiaG
MSNLESALKNEMARIAGKVVRQRTQGLKTTVSPYRSEIAALKRRVHALEQQLRQVAKVTTVAAKARATGTAQDETESHLRFSAKGLANHRKRLRLSAKDCGALIGASSLSVYKWESGKARPRAKYIEAIAKLRTMGKKETAAALALLAG